MYRVESLLSARMFSSPQLAGERIFFLSNSSGHLSLYAMDRGGSVPEPLLPPNIALQNPHLIEGFSFVVFPKVGKIVVMIDQDGDENYQPMSIPLDGGFPEPAFGAAFEGYRVHLTEFDRDQNILYLTAESRAESRIDLVRANLVTGRVEKLYSSEHGLFPIAVSSDHKQVILAEGYTMGDIVLYKLQDGQANTLHGVPLAQREPGERVKPSGFSSAAYTANEKSLLLLSALFEDTFSLGILELEKPQEVLPVTVNGVVHTGAGEMVALHHLKADVYTLEYNIDGVSWLYETTYHAAERTMSVKRVLCGEGELANGVLGHVSFEKESGRFVLDFCTATSPTQIYLIEGENILRQTNERVLGIPAELLSSGEDASFTSHDGRRISARLYLPSAKLGYQGKLPVVFYIHGGPQGQERPDFAWFSMPLIQLLALNGLAVFVPNVRGSTGYGLEFTKLVDHDWGGDDRLDHVHALKLLENDQRLDAKRAGVVGRSYGGYMTLTLAGRHADLWSGAVDMFGPYDLITFSERIPETWKPYFKIVLGDPQDEKDRAFLVERSPKTYIDQLQCSMLVIQGRNDPRVVEQESRDLVTHLQSIGKQVDLLVFENEGHDVLKYENRVRCYNEIVNFFKRTLTD